MRRAVIVSYENKDGFTRALLARLISDEYHNIYEIEEQTTDKSPALLSGWLNRNETNGAYGIYGHMIEDLLLHTLWYDPSTRVVRLGVDS